MERSLFKIVVVFSVLAGIQAQDVCEGITDGVWVPVKNDCRGFYICPTVDQSNACPKDLYFSEAEKDCVVSNEHCVFETTTAISETDSPIHEDCKDIENSEYIIFIPSKTDCASYYFCHNGQPQEMSCIPGMYWNQAELKCDWSDNVECLITTTTELPTTTATPEICPETDLPVFVPSTTNCGEYYMCYKGNPQLLTCAEEMHWNQETLQCDYPENVNCEIDSLPKCPETGVHFYPHPEKCSQYISCYYGKRTVVNCPFNEVWDTVQNKCLSENLATCTLD